MGSIEKFPCRAVTSLLLLLCVRHLNTDAAAAKRNFFAIVMRELMFLIKLAVLFIDCLLCSKL